MDKEKPIKKETIFKDDRSLKNKNLIKTTIKPSEAEIEEIRKLWEKFHKELLDKTSKDNDKK